MNSISKLIKSKTISFVEVLINNYKKIGLNEIDTLIISKLYYQLDAGNLVLSSDNVAEEMTISKNEVSERILNLCEKGYVDMQLVDGKEEFNLDGTIEKLGNALMNENDDSIVESRKEKVTQIAAFLEATLSRVLNSSDYEIVNDWVNENYSLESIKSAVFTGVKANKTSLKYIDAILVNKKPRKETELSKNEEEIADLLKDVYVK